jgi:hypothetical protein
MAQMTPRFERQLLDRPTNPQRCIRCDKVGSYRMGAYHLKCAFCGLVRHEDAHKPAPLRARVLNFDAPDFIKVPPAQPLPPCECGNRFFAATDLIRYTGDYCPRDAFITVRCVVCLKAHQIQLIGAAGKNLP